MRKTRRADQPTEPVPAFFDFTDHKNRVFNLDLRPARHLRGWIIEGRNPDHYGGHYWRRVGFASADRGRFKTRKAALAAIRDHLRAIV